MCCPGGKIAALFVDIDGTAMICQPYFDGAFEEFATVMELLGVPRDASKKALGDIYYGSMPHRGFERERFPEGIIETYHHLCTEHKLTPRGDILPVLERIGNAPFFRKPELFPNALQVLTRAQHNFKLIAVTVGDREVQKYKIRQGGLDAIFDETIITLREGKAELVREAIEDYNIDPNFSAFIGNSVRSDGVCLSKTNFIFLPLESSLSKNGDKLPEDTGFKTFEVVDWRDAEERAIKRLLRQRKMAMGDDEGKSALQAQPGGCAGCAACQKRRKR
jgi:FMN phosphatase YigB (HAD superfamily)